MAREFGVQHLDVYQKAVGILDSLCGLSGEGPLTPLLAAKGSEVVSVLVDALETWGDGERREALYKARRTAHQLSPLIEVGARNGLFDEEEAKRLGIQVDDVSKMLYAMAKNVGQKKEAASA